MDLGKIRYGLSGLTGRLSQSRVCPDCDNSAAERVDLKGFHGLYRCQNCLLNYRFPTETPEQMARFYQRSYQSNSIATEVPSSAELQRLRAEGVKNSVYDRSWHQRVYGQLGMFAAAKVLDFGTSWGYFTLQLKQAGFDALGFEISQPRATIGQELGIQIYSDESKLPTDLDVVCSTHVIEHVPCPLKKLHQMLSWVKPGGVVMGFTPNGAPAAQRAQPEGFHRVWGLVHPVLLSPEAIARRFPQHALMLTSDDGEENLRLWRGEGRKIDRCDGLGLLFAIRRAE